MLSHSSNRPSSVPTHLAALPLSLAFPHSRKFTRFSDQAEHSERERSAMYLAVIITRLCFFSFETHDVSRGLVKCVVILPVVFHGCETWSVTLRDEHSLIVFENGVLRKGRGNRGVEKSV